MRTAASQPDMGMSRPYDADSIDPTRNAISQNRHAFMQLAAAEGRITYPGKSYLLQALNGLPDELVDSMMDKVKGCSEVSLRSWMTCFNKMVEENVAPELPRHPSHDVPTGTVEASSTNGIGVRYRHAGRAVLAPVRNHLE